MAEQEEVAVPAQKGKLKTILLLVVVLVVAVGLSVAGTLWFLKEPQTGAGTETAEPDFAPALYWAMTKPLVTTVRHSGTQRYVQVYLAFEADEQAPLDAVEKHLPLIRNTLISTLGQADFMGLQSTEGRSELPDQLLVAVNEVLEQEREPEVRRVLLRNFVVQ